AETLLVIPTPTIEPVIVLVFETGIPKNSDKYKVMATAGSADTPSNRDTFVILVPTDLTIFHPPLTVPNQLTIKLVNGTHQYSSTKNENRSSAFTQTASPC